MAAFEASTYGRFWGVHRGLREAGFSERQAEGQAQALAAAMTESLATKQDLRELETRLDARFDIAAALLAENLADLERRMTVRLGAMVVAGIGAVSILVRLG